MSTMQTENKSNRFLDGYSIQEKSTVLIVAANTVLLLLASVVGFLLSGGQNSSLLLPTLLLGITNAFGVYLALKKRKTAAISVLLISIFFMSVFIITRMEGVAINLAFGYIVVGTGLTLFTLESSQYIKVLSLVLAAAIFMLLLGFMWPFERVVPGPFFAEIANTISIILVVVYMVVGVVQFPSYSLVGKVVASMVLITFVALMTLASVFIYLVSQSLTMQVGDDLDAFAKTQAVSVGELLTRNLDTLETLSTNGSIVGEAQLASRAYNTGDRSVIEEQLRAYDPIWNAAGDADPIVTQVLNGRIVNELEKFRILFPGVIDLFITDKYGGLIAATSRTPDYYQGDEPWWIDAYSLGFGARAIGAPFYIEERDDWFIEISAPIHGENLQGNSEVVGVLMAAVRLNTLGELLASGQFGETGKVEILTPEGHVLYVDEAGLLTIESLNFESRYDAVNVDEVFTRSEVDGSVVLLSGTEVNTLNPSSAVDRIDWVVVVSQAETEALLSVRDLQVATVALSIVVVILTAGLASWIGRRLSQPIINLTAVAEQVAQGDLTIRAEVASLNEQDEIGSLSVAFNQMTDWLRDSISNLELRVEERTRAIATSSDVGRRLSTILDRNELVEAVVTLVQKAFDYYHVHIYLIDEEGQSLTMAGGTGEAGQKMLASHHQIRLGHGLVGRAAATNAPVLVADVENEAEWLPNPLLPNTRAETAVPIAIGERVLGVLDVQQDKEYGLSQNDVELLVSITNQVAIALQIAEYLETAQIQAKQETISNEIGQKIRGAKSVEQALQIAVRELGRALDAPKTRVILKNGSAQTPTAD